MSHTVSILQYWALEDGAAPDWAGLRAVLEGAPGARVEAAHAMPPGTLVLAGEPVWQLLLRGVVREADLRALDAALSAIEPALQRRTADRMVQVYRQVDEVGRLRGDALRWLDDEPVPGMVLLVSVWADGGWRAPMPSPADAAQRHARQRAALPAEPGDETSLAITDERG